jgi:hypothetical protein
MERRGEERRIDENEE